MAALSRRLVALARTRLTWVPGLCGAPDVPKSAAYQGGGEAGSLFEGVTGGRSASGLVVSNNDGSLVSVKSPEIVVIHVDLLDIAKKQQHKHSGSGITSSNGGINTPQDILGRSQGEPVKICFNFGGNLNDNSNVWEGVIWQGDLFLTIPGFMIERSKEAFITLLEYAEEELRCNSIIVCFSKLLVDRATTIRMFMFFGFELLPPNNPKAPSQANDKLYMAYQVV